MRCPSTAGVVASSCGPTVELRIGMSPGTRPHEDKRHIVRLDAKPCIIEFFMFNSLPLSLLNFEHFMFN
jgi:hypothetical protein